MEDKILSCPNKMAHQLGFFYSRHSFAFFAQSDLEKGGAVLVMIEWRLP
jgi:hypothetical protein